jgi:hypothetical protein
MAPARGLVRIWGTAVKRATRARVVASPVACHAHMVMANWVMPVPRRETSWPNQMMVKPFMPVGRRVWGSSVVPLSPVSGWVILMDPRMFMA